MEDLGLCPSSWRRDSVSSTALGRRDLPRSHWRYRKRCGRCRRYLPQQVRSYCARCNAARRRADRVRISLALMDGPPGWPSRWTTTGDALEELLGPFRT